MNGEVRKLNTTCFAKQINTNYPQDKKPFKQPWWLYSTIKHYHQNINVTVNLSSCSSDSSLNECRREEKPFSQSGFWLFISQNRLAATITRFPQLINTNKHNIPNRNLKENQKSIFVIIVLTFNMTTGSTLKINHQFEAIFHREVLLKNLSPSFQQ